MIVVPPNVMRAIVRARHQRIQEACHKKKPVEGCGGIPSDGGIDPCYSCGEPNAPYCNNHISKHVAVCGHCYDEQATFYELDVLVNG